MSLNESIAIVERQQPIEGGPYDSNFTDVLFAKFARREAEELLTTPPPLQR